MNILRIFWCLILVVLEGFGEAGDMLGWESREKRSRGAKHASPQFVKKNGNSQLKKHTKYWDKQINKEDSIQCTN